MVLLIISGQLQVLSGETTESFTEVILRNYFGDEAAKRGQAAIIAKYLQRELHCLQVRAGTPSNEVYPKEPHLIKYQILNVVQSTKALPSLRYDL